jgi:hypothetical protein
MKRQRNPGQGCHRRVVPDCASLHPGYGRATISVIASASEAIQSLARGETMDCCVAPLPAMTVVAREG